MKWHKYPVGHASGMVLLVFSVSSCANGGWDLPVVANGELNKKVAFLHE
jgi:hypothetical protein